MYGFHVIKEIGPPAPVEDEFTVASPVVVRRLDGTVTVEAPYTPSELSAIVERGEERAKRLRKRPR